MKYDFDEIVERRGTYCTQWDYVQDRFGEKDILPFSISDTDFKIPMPITEKILEVSKQEIYGYTRWNHHDFKASIASFFQRRHDTFVDESWIVYSPSVMYSVSLLIRLLSKPKDVVVTFNPMYDAFFSVIQENDRILVSNKLIHEKSGCFRIDFEKFEGQLKDAEILLLCSPHNPTGRTWTMHEMEQIIRCCKKYDVKIISDEIHMDIQLKQRKHKPIITYRNIYTELYLVSSCSKTFNVPGLIGSYAILPQKDILGKFQHQLRKVDFLNSASIFGMYATMVGYTKCDDYIDQMNTYIKENMLFVEAYIKNELPDFRFQMPDATYLAWLDVRSVPFNSIEIQHAFVHVGKVAIMSGETYGENGMKYLRMNCGCPRAKLKEGMQRIKCAMTWLYQQKDS